MVEVIGVRFRTNGKIYYFNPENYDVHSGDHVIVETIRGVEYGQVVLERRQIGEQDIVATLKPTIRWTPPWTAMPTAYSKRSISVSQTVSPSWAIIRTPTALRL